MFRCLNVCNVINWCDEKLTVSDVKAFHAFSSLVTFHKISLSLFKTMTEFTNMSAPTPTGWPLEGPSAA